MNQNGYFLFLPVKIESCLIGQFYDPSILLCQECEPGYYSLTNDSIICEPCLESAICPGGAEIGPQDHY